MFETERRALFPQRCLGECGCFDTPACLTCVRDVLDPSYMPLPPLGSVAWVASYKTPFAKTLIRALKFSSERDLGGVLSGMMTPYANRFRPDLVIPVPLHRSRQTQRGYNQAELLASGLHHVRTDLLIRHRFTLPQTSLPGPLRRKNLKDAFCPTRSSEFKGRHILLIDDVFTTGTTLKECAKTLINAGANRVNALVFAKSD